MSAWSEGGQLDPRRSSRAVWARGLLDDLRWFRRNSLRAGRLLVLQVLIQGIGAATSFLFVRGMSKQEFGWLTIVSAFLTTVSVLSDSGSGAGLQALAGRLWKDRTEMGQLVIAAQQTRHQLALLVALLFGPAFLWLLMHNGAAPAYAAALTTIACATVWHMTGTAALAVACRMHSCYEDVQLAEATGAISKLAIALGSLAVRLNAGIAAAASLLAVVIQNLRTRRVAARLVKLDSPGPATRRYRRELLAFLKPLALPTLFFVFQGQLGVWLLGAFGKVDSVADLGALSRFGVLLGIFASTANHVAGAAFARCDSRQALRQQERRVFGGTLLAFAAPAAALVLAPSLALRLLGTGYLHLTTELRLLVLVSLLSTVAGLLWSLNTSRGWVRQAWLLIPVTLAMQCVAILWVSTSTVLGALTFSLLHNVATVSVYAILAVRGHRQWSQIVEG